MSPFPLCYIATLAAHKTATINALHVVFACKEKNFGNSPFRHMKMKFFRHQDAVHNVLFHERMVRMRPGLEGAGGSFATIDVAIDVTPQQPRQNDKNVRSRTHDGRRSSRIVVFAS